MFKLPAEAEFRHIKAASCVEPRDTAEPTFEEAQTAVQQTIDDDAASL